MKITYENLLDVKKTIVRNRWIDVDVQENRAMIRALLFSTFAENDYVEVADEKACKLAISLGLATYDRNGTGFNGIKKEILTRRNNRKILYRDDWFKHKAGAVDYYINGHKNEGKTGCGAWMYHTGTLADARKAYEETGEYIDWHYIHRKNPDVKNDYSFRIDIHCTWKRFFKYLDTYPLGWETFFKKNVKSKTAGVNIYELQTIKNSKRKILFLQAFGK